MAARLCAAEAEKEGSKSLESDQAGGEYQDESTKGTPFTTKPWIKPNET